MKNNWAILILFLAGVVAYGNTINNGLFWDDDEFITKNAYIRSFRYLPKWLTQPLTAGAGVNSNYYRPLLTASFSLDYHLWGLWPAGYHFENILWHITAAIFLYFFLIELLRQFRIQNPEFRIAPTVAFATSLVWLVHPVNVEAVAYANSRGDSMATVFILLTLILWVKKRFLASAATFVLALMSKEFAIVTPGLILLIEFTKVQSWRVPRFDLLKLSPRFSPHLVIVAVYFLLRLTVFNFQNTLNFYGANQSSNKNCDVQVQQRLDLCLYATSIFIRALTFFRVLPIYTGILIWPNNLHMERTVEIPTSIADPIVTTVLIVVAAIGILFLYAMFKGPTLASPKVGPYQIFLFAVSWFFISILPVSGLIPISQILAEHFLYLPSIGFFLLVSWIIISLIQKRIPLLIIFYFLLIPLLIKTIRQNRVWRDPITFYEYTLAHAKPTARVYNNLAMAYADVKENQKAINNYNKAIELGDVYPNPHYNLGNTLIEIGKLDEAEREYRRALEIDPSFHYATLKLGQMYLDQGKIDDAKRVVCPVFPTQPLCR